MSKVVQKIATRIFIYASATFGVLGMVHVLTLPSEDSQATAFNEVVIRLLVASVFIILSSFALSIAGKYLKDK